MTEDINKQINYLKSVIREHDHRYYVLDDPQISDHEYDSVTNTLDQDASACKGSYTVSDAISVSYAQETIEKPSSTDAEYTRLTASHTSGGMTISATLAEMDNGTHTTSVAGDDEYAALSVSFAF